MTLKDITFPSPEENIIFDDVLLQLAEEGVQGEVLRFWESSDYFVVLGRIGKESDDVRTEETQKDGIPVLRRSSGGGTVLQGRGCLNYSLVLSKDSDPSIADLRRSYQFILAKVVHALKTAGVDAVFYPTSDIALTDSKKKISGNAQKRLRRFILHHGTLLYDFDLERITRYLKMPAEVPDYRRGRSHADFVANMPVQRRTIIDAFRKEFRTAGLDEKPNANERARLDQLLAARK